MTAPALFYWAELMWPSIGGIETFSQALLPRLVERGYTVHVLTEDLDGTRPARETIGDVVFHRLPLRKPMETADPGMLLRNLRLVRQLKQDIGPALLHLNFSGPMAFYHLRTAQTPPVPMVTTLHGTLGDLRGSTDTLFGEILKQSDWIVANSQVVLDDLHAAAPASAPRSSVIYCGVDSSRRAAPAAATAALELLCVGRLVPEKGMDLALTAFASIQPAFPTARLTVAGGGPEQPALEQQARDLGITGNVRFTGWVDPAQVPALMASASLVVVPSRWVEPFGLVAVEAALQARPVLAAAVGGLRETIEDGVTGRLVPKDDAAALAAAMTAMLSDPASLAAMGERAHARACRLFSMDSTVDALDALYKRLMHGS